MKNTWYDDVTEASEGNPTAVQARANLTEKWQQYRAGEETYGVLALYEQAAIEAGVSAQDLALCRGDV